MTTGASQGKRDVRANAAFRSHGAVAAWLLSSVAAALADRSEEAPTLSRCACASAIESKPDRTTAAATAAAYLMERFVERDGLESGKSTNVIAVLSLFSGRRQLYAISPLLPRHALRRQKTVILARAGM
jgi:hypothetical protein